MFKNIRIFKNYKLVELFYFVNMQTFQSALVNDITISLSSLIKFERSKQILLKIINVNEIHIYAHICIYEHFFLAQVKSVLSTEN